MAGEQKKQEQQEQREKKKTKKWVPPFPLLPRMDYTPHVSADADKPPFYWPPTTVMFRNDDDSDESNGWLFLGSEVDAINPVYITEKKITRFIHACRNCKCDFKQDDPAHLRIAIHDSPGEDISRYFEIAVAFLDKAKEENANVLVHCLAGISRSPTIVLAYMINQGATTADALADLKRCRECVNPNIYFGGALFNYEKSLNR